MINNFADRLIEQIRKKESAVVAGLDPTWEGIPEKIRHSASSVSDAVFEYNRRLIDALYDIVPAVKPQLAYYELLGLEGLSAYHQTVRYAKSKGLLVIADGKRNDIGSTSEAYAKAFLDINNCVDNFSVTRSAADALTVNPYLGIDGIAPFCDECNKNGAGIFVLVKTSNPSSGQLQDIKTEDGTILYERVASLVAEWGEDLIGKSGYSFVGAVVGATYPDQAKALRRLMPRTIILVPGYGAQGGSADTAAVNFNDDGLGAIVNASRSVMHAYKSPKWAEKYTADTFDLAARSEAIAMTNAINEAVARKLEAKK
ncbi:MAG: orotidine-5'-phosphate decarboxylase [Clostridiales bacterium]|nr:orotidine-5'-phosphate decarboxylase [Clostridiales bacterium]